MDNWEPRVLRDGDLRLDVALAWAGKLCRGARIKVAGNQTHSQDSSLPVLARRNG